MIRLAIILVLYTVVFSGQSAATEDSSPTLARLSFWVPPERRTALEAVYEKQVAPFLAQQGLFTSAKKRTGRLILLADPNLAQLLLPDIHNAHQMRPIYRFCDHIGKPVIIGILGLCLGNFRFLPTEICQPLPAKISVGEKSMYISTPYQPISANSAIG